MPSGPLSSTQAGNHWVRGKGVVVSIQVRSIKGHFREGDGSLTEGKLMLIDVPGKGVCSEGGLQVRARWFKDADGVDRTELYGPDMSFAFLPDVGECERAGIPVDPAG